MRKVLSTLIERGLIPKPMPGTGKKGIGRGRRKRGGVVRKKGDTFMRIFCRGKNGRPVRQDIRILSGPDRVKLDGMKNDIIPFERLFAPRA